MINRLEEIVKKNCADWEIDLIEFNGEADHIHLLLDMHPNIRDCKLNCVIA
ncbi:transposase [Acinetobacter sp. YH01020]|uniref:transposase n=1 Tax=Acinetobacter sp. YH01020 TaxID=2601034 RepID=UPI0035A271E0